MGGSEYPKEPTCSKDLYKEIIIRNPNKGRLFGVRVSPDLPRLQVAIFGL